MKKKIIPMLLLTAVSLVGCSSAKAYAKLVDTGGSIFNTYGSYYYCRVYFRATKKAHHKYYHYDFSFYDGGSEYEGDCCSLGEGIDFNADGTITNIDFSYLSGSAGRDATKNNEDYVYVFFKDCPSPVGTVDTVYYRGTSVTCDAESVVSVYCGHQ